MPPEDKIRSTDIIRELVETYDATPSRPTKQRQVHQLILDGRIPAERGSDGKFSVVRGNLPMIAEILGMTPRSSKIAA